MKIRVLAGILVIGALVAVAPVALGQDGPQGLDTSWMKAIMAGDANAVAGLYASDAVLWFPNAPEARGAKAIQDAYTGFLNTYKVSDVSFTDTHYETVQNIGVASGHFMMTLTPKAGGAPTIMGGRYSSVAKKAADGTWRYVVDHASVEPPPPAPAAKK